MESKLDAENPTTGDSGASITDRLESFLSAGKEPEQKIKEPPQPSQEGQDVPESAETPDKPDDGAPEKDSQPQLTTADLAKVLGIDESALDVDADGNVSIKTKIDGKEGAAKFADLLKTHQIQGHAENTAREAAQLKAAMQARTQEVEQQLQQRLGHAEQLAAIAQQELMAEFNQYDWKALDQHPDQGAVAALKIKFQERSQKIQNALQGINAQRGELGKQAEARKASRLAEEAAKLPTLIPEWKDQAVQAKESKELTDWMLKRGYTPEAVRALSDSSALDVATFRMAMKQDTLQQSKAVVENKVRLAPKIVKPGQAQPEGPAQKLNDLRANIRKSGGKGGSVAAYLTAAGLV